MLRSVIALAGLNLCISHVAAHSKMAVPVATFAQPPEENSPIGSLDESQWNYPSTINSWDGAAKGNYALNASNSKTLREFVMKYYKPNKWSTTKECGQTLLTGERQPVPDTIKFPAGHPGPCEFWCDNVRVGFDPDCNGNKITSLTIDKSKCAKASIVQGLYIGTHNSPWEVYINCAPIAGGKESDPSKVLDPNASGDGVASSPVASDEYEYATKTDAPKMETPSMTSPPSPQTNAPRPAVPSPSKANCRRRVRN